MYEGEALCKGGDVKSSCDFSVRVREMLGTHTLSTAALRGFLQHTEHRASGTTNKWLHNDDVILSVLVSTKSTLNVHSGNTFKGH